VVFAKIRIDHNVVLREIGNQHVVAGVGLVYGQKVRDGETVLMRID
jgi:hypothetical protein